jgi:hypothetical protein
MPWFIHSIRQLYSPHAMACVRGSKYAFAVSEPYACNPLERLRAAWWVITGRAHAFEWPRPGDIESALGMPFWDRRAEKREDKPRDGESDAAYRVRMASRQS